MTPRYANAFRRAISRDVSRRMMWVGLPLRAYAKSS